MSNSTLMFGTLGTIVAGIILSITGAAHAATGTATPTHTLLSFHQPHQDFTWVTGTTSLHGPDATWHSLQPASDARSACHHRQLCLWGVHNRYATARTEWRAYNRDVWTQAAGLPDCAGGDQATVDCVTESGFSGLSVVSESGSALWAQDSLR